MTDRLKELAGALPGILDDVPGNTVGSWIAGRWVVVDGGEPMVVDNPSTGEVLFEFADGGAQAAEAALTAAREAHARGEWRGLTAAERGRVLWRIGQAIRDVGEALSRTESLMVGRPLADTRKDVAAIAAMFEYYAGWCDKFSGEVIPVPSAHLNYTLREPYGVVVQLTPWNAPIFTGGWQLAPALCTGNCIVLKPSEFAPLTSLALVRLVEAAGVPAGTVNVVLGGGTGTGATLVSSPKADKVVFIGSVPTGRRVAEAAGRNLTPCLLELGGKSPNVILPGVDYAVAARSAVAGVMQAAGQSCTALSRILVHEKDVHDVAELVRVRAEALRIGPAVDERTELGPLCHRGHLERVMRIVEEGQTQATRVLTGGKRATDMGPGYFYAPTVVLDPEGTSPLAQNEIFGPVVVVTGFTDEEDAIGKANESDYGLAAMVWARDVAQAHRVAAKLEAGTVWINGSKALHVMSPFGGYKSSGYGRSSGIDALAEYTRSKSVWVDLAG